MDVGDEGSEATGQSHVHRSETRKDSLNSTIGDHWTGQTRSEVSGARSLGDWNGDARGTFVCCTACTHFCETVWSWADSAFDDSTKVLAVVDAFNRALHAFG